MPKHLTPGILIDIAKITAICVDVALFQYLMDDPNYQFNFFIILILCYTAYAVTIFFVRWRRKKK